MADITVTSTDISAEYAAEGIAFGTATEDAAGAAQKFVVTQTRADAECLLIVDISGATTGKGNVKVNIASGNIIGGAAPATITVDEGDIAVIKLSGIVKNSDGKINVTLDPAADTSKLKTDLAAKVGFVQSSLTK